MTTPAGPPFLDLGSYLAWLENAGKLRRVSAPVDKDWQIACITRWAVESTTDHDAYAILFENVQDHSTPVAVNLFATRNMYAAALGVEPDQLLTHWAHAVANPIQPVLIDDGPVHEIVATGAAADLLRLPTPVWTPGRDAGPYLSAACVITKDPDTGVQNMATYRVQVHDAGHAGLFFGSKLQHGAMHFAKYCRRGESMPVAIVVGAAPAVCFAAAAKTAYGVDEMEIAGGLAGVGLEVVRGRTVDLLVPARAECVIEGLVHPGIERNEGPFGEALGYMNLAAPAPVVEIAAICQRRSAVHHGYIQQLPPTEGHLVMELGSLGPLWHYLINKLRLKGVRDIAIAPGSAGLAILLVQLARPHAHDAERIGRVLSNLHIGQKYIYLVDEDVDIRDPKTVNWIVSSRVDPQSDLRIVADTSSYMVDPATLARARSAHVKLGDPPYPSSVAVVDATLKCRVPEVSLPGASLMQRALEMWDTTGLPPIQPNGRLKRLLDTHSENALELPIHEPADRAPGETVDDAPGGGA